MKYIVYMLVCRDNSFFSGMTTDLVKEYKKHKNKEVTYTKSRLPAFVVYEKEFNSEVDATNHLDALKSKKFTHAKKLEFIKSSISNYVQDINKSADEVRILLHENHGFNGLQFLFKDNNDKVIESYSRCMNPNCPLDNIYVNDLTSKRNNKAYILR